MAFLPEYQRAAAAAEAAKAAAQQTHAALFDFAAELGRLAEPLTAGGNPLGLGVRFVRRAPPHLDAPRGVMVEDAPKDRPDAFAAAVLATNDLWFEIRSDPTQPLTALTNIPEMEIYASRISGVTNVDDKGQVRLLQRVLQTGEVAVPPVSTAAQLLEAFLVHAGNVFAQRAEAHETRVAVSSAV